MITWTYCNASTECSGEEMGCGNCRIVARPVLSPDAARQNGDEMSGADVICSQPEVLHRELEPMNEMEKARPDRK